MKRYDVVIVGGSIAGSVAGRFLAEKGFKTLIIEAAKTPREKACSGIQFRYFEKLLGIKIPKDRLCNNELNRLYMEYPNGDTFKIPFSMLNFTRIILDNWLNEIAIESGVEFRDCTQFDNFKYDSNEYIVSIKPRKKDTEYIRCKYLIAADGLMSKIRRKLRPQDFSNKPFAPTMNYYLKTKGDGDLNPNTLYQFWNLEFSNLMFAWTYKKNDLWVVGSGHTNNLIERCDALLEYVKTKFNLEGEIVKKEGFASNLRLDNPNHVFLGEKNLLFIGDAAGLVDMYRGLGMDAAALSGRLAAKAIERAEKKDILSIQLYEKYLERIVKKIKKNTNRIIYHYKSNDELLKGLKKSSLKMGIVTLFANLLNKILPANRIILLPS